MVNNTNANGVNNIDVIPSGILCNTNDKEILVTTKNDMRVIDAYTGRVIRIVADLVDTDSEVSEICMTNRDIKMLVGDS